MAEAKKRSESWLLETAEMVGRYFGLQSAGNMNVAGDGATINRLRAKIDAEMKKIVDELPPGTIDAWPRLPE